MFLGGALLGVVFLIPTTGLAQGGRRAPDKADKRADADTGEAKKKAQEKRRQERAQKAEAKRQQKRASREKARAKAAKARAEKAKARAEEARARKAAAEAENAKARAEKAEAEAELARVKEELAQAKARAQKAKNAAGSPLTVLVIGMAGEKPSADSEQPFTDTLKAVLRARTDRPVELRMGKTATIDITGCSVESEECYDAVANVLDVEWMVFGSIEAKDKDGARPVTLTRVDAQKRTYDRRRILLRSSTASQREEFEVKARAFLDGLPDPDTATNPARKPSDRHRRAFGLSQVGGVSWGVAGGGAVALATGFILLSAASSKQAEVDEAPVNNVADLERLAALERSGQRYTAWGNAMTVLGGVATAVGVGMIVYQGYRKDDEKPPAPVTITPSVGPWRGINVVIGGTF